MHNIEIRNGEASFAFNRTNGDPWHRLGTPVDGAGTAIQMLSAAKADWTVEFAPLFVQMPDGTFVEVETHQSTVRNLVSLTDSGVDLTYDVLGVVGKQYNIEQNEACAEWALEMVGAAAGDAAIDTMGVLRDGRTFFVCVDLGTLVLDPDGARDVIKRYFIATNSHDGSSALRGFATDTRVVCSNTLNYALHGAQKGQGIYSVRHTSGKDDLKRAAVEAYGMAREVHEVWLRQIEQLWELDGGVDKVVELCDQLWPAEKGESERASNNRRERKAKVVSIYESPNNAWGFGDTGWTVWNAVGEYLDHARPRMDAQRMAQASADPSGAVARTKRAAAELLLATA